MRWLEIETNIPNLPQRLTLWENRMAKIARKQKETFNLDNIELLLIGNFYLTVRKGTDERTFLVCLILYICLHTLDGMEISIPVIEGCWYGRKIAKSDIMTRLFDTIQHHYHDALEPAIGFECVYPKVVSRCLQIMD